MPQQQLDEITPLSLEGELQVENWAMKSTTSDASI